VGEVYSRLECSLVELYQLIQMKTSGGLRRGLRTRVLGGIGTAVPIDATDLNDTPAHREIDTTKRS